MKIPIQAEEVEKLFTELGSNPRSVLTEGKELLYRGEENRNGNYLMLLNVLGAAELSLGNYQEAHQYIDRGLKIDNNPHLLHTRASIFLKQGLPDDALKSVERSILLAGDQPDFYMTQASILLALGMWEEVETTIAILGKAESLESHCLFLNGSLNHRKGNAELAEKDLKRSIQLDGKYAPAYLELAELYKSQNNHQNVLDTLNKLGTDKFTNEHYFVALGDAYFELEKVDSARAVYEEALKVNAQNLAASIKLARLDKASNRKDKALKRILQFLTYDLTDEIRIVVNRELGYLSEEPRINDDAFKYYRRSLILYREIAENALSLQQRLEQEFSESINIKLKNQASNEEGEVSFIVGLPSTTLDSFINSVKDLSGKFVRLDDNSAPFEESRSTSLSPSIYWHPHGLLKLPKLLELYPDARVLFIKQHPKDACISNLRREVKLTHTDSAFFSWESTKIYIESLLELKFKLDQDIDMKNLFIEDLIRSEAHAWQEFENWVGAPLSVETHMFEPLKHQLGEWANLDSQLTSFTSNLSTLSNKLGYVNA